MMKSLFCTWASTLGGTVGICVVKDGATGKLCIRAAPIIGGSRANDENFVAEWGGRVPIQDLKKMIDIIESDKK